MAGMKTHQLTSPGSTVAQAFTEELLVRAGIVPGMHVAVVGAGTGDVAFLAAERVGDGGRVLAVEANAELAACARRRAHEQCFERISLRVGDLADIAAEAPFDAVIGRFFLLHRRDPVAAVRQCAGLVRSGGRVVFAEWHYESMLWAHASAWPDPTLYHRVAAQTLDGLRRAGAHADMGLRLVNTFVEAGLPLPAVRLDLRACTGANPVGFEFFAETLRELLPATDVRFETLAERLRQEASAGNGHAFLPLLVGAWARTEDASGV